jgi:hypothetical protein
MWQVGLALKHGRQPLKRAFLNPSRCIAGNSNSPHPFFLTPSTGILCHITGIHIHRSATLTSHKGKMIVRPFRKIPGLNPFSTKYLLL